MNARKKLDELKNLWGFKTDSELAEYLGITKYAVDNWVKRDKISNEYLLKIGQMTDKQSLHVNDKVTINYYEDIRVSAGYGASNFEIQPTKLIFDKKYLSDVIGINVFKNLEMVKVLGDSMEPFVKDGDFAMIQRKTDIRNNDIVIANINGDIFVKKIIKDLDKKEVRFVSFNENYPDITIKDKDLDGVAIIGVVIAKFDMNVKIF